jgi:hypothetical protein
VSVEKGNWGISPLYSPLLPSTPLYSHLFLPPSFFLPLSSPPRFRGELGSSVWWKRRMRNTWTKRQSLVEFGTIIVQISKISCFQWNSKIVSFWTKEFSCVVSGAIKEWKPNKKGGRKWGGKGRVERGEGGE